MRRIVPAVLLIAAACGPAIRVTRNESIPIYPRASYAWARADGTPTAAELDPRVDNDSVRARIERAVNAELQRRGFTKAPFRDAQLIVHYHVGVRDKLDTLAAEQYGACNSIPCPSPSYDWGYWGAPERAIREVAYEEGSLMIDFLARPSLELAWRGSTVAEVSAVLATDAQIRKAVGRLLRKFPGKG